MANYHIINENYFKENNVIKLSLNDDKVLNIIDLKKKREKYMCKNYDISIIEILKTDKIKNFLNLDDNIFKDKTELFYEDEPIYTIQYPNGK